MDRSKSGCGSHIDDVAPQEKVYQRPKLFSDKDLGVGNTRYNSNKENSTIMKLILFYRGLKARPVWQTLVEAQFKRLQYLAAIVSAKVTLEWQRGIKPAFRVLALLEVPGPDFHVEARDHTVQAAVLKAVKDLERQIRSRKARRADRWKTNLQLGMTPSRSSFALVGHRA